MTAVEAIVRDAYAALRNVLRRRLVGQDRAAAALDAEETEPGVWQVRLGDDRRVD